METVLISMSKADLSRLIVDAVHACLHDRPAAPRLADETLNVEQLKEKYGFTQSFIYKHTSANTIPFFKKGKKLYFSKLAIEKWLRENPVKTISEIESEAATRVALS